MRLIKKQIKSNTSLDHTNDLNLLTAFLGSFWNEFGTIMG